MSSKLKKMSAKRTVKSSGRVKQQKFLQSNFWSMLLVFIFLVPGYVWLQQTEDIFLYFHYDMLSGQLLYVFAKLFGLYAFMLFWLQTLYGLLGYAGRKHLNIAEDFVFHRNLGLLVLTFILTHVTLFVVATSLRLDTIAVNLLAPNLFGGYYYLMMSFGAFGLWFSIIAIIAAVFRRKLKKFWLWIHRLSSVTFFLLFIHSYFIGSETRTAPLSFLYFFMLCSIVIILGYRLWEAFFKARKQMP